MVVDELEIQNLSDDHEDFQTVWLFPQVRPVLISMGQKPVWKHRRQVQTVWLFPQVRPVFFPPDRSRQALVWSCLSAGGPLGPQTDRPPEGCLHAANKEMNVDV